MNTALQTAANKVTEAMEKIGFIPASVTTYHWEVGNKRYFHTKDKMLHNGKFKYIAGIHRYIKTRNEWKLTKKVGFAKKRKAIEWAKSKYLNHTA